MADDVDHWTREAANWIAWARTPGHDAFWAYRAAFQDFVGPGRGRPGLEIGAGEGRVSRALGEVGWRMTLAEPVGRLLDAAREAESGVAYHPSSATALPMPDRAFDLVVLYNVLMDVADLAGAAAEATRVLAPGGRLIVGIVHPIAEVLPNGADQEVAGLDYFAESRFKSRIETDGLSMTFSGWARPLSAYVAALADAGLAITGLAEPRPDPASGWHGVDLWSMRPLFLWLEARHT